MTSARVQTPQTLREAVHELPSCSCALSREAWHVPLVVLVASSTHHLFPARWLQSEAQCELVIPMKPLHCPVHLPCFRQLSYYS